jgi:hypothetical protein
MVSGGGVSVRPTPGIVAFYLFLLILVFFFYLFDLQGLTLSVPVLMIMSPLIFRTEIRLSAGLRSLGEALLLSSTVLLPLVFFVLVSGGRLILPPLRAVSFHLLIASIPEEVFFRGVLQEKSGNTGSAVFLSSIAFTGLHSPRYLIGGDLSAILTFFPSLIMGWLYMKKRNLLYPITFHFLSNLFFISILGPRL